MSGREGSDLLSSIQHALQCYMAGGSAAHKAYSDAAGHSASNDASVEGAHDGCWGSCSGLSWPVIQCYLSKRGPQ